MGESSTNSKKHYEVTYDDLPLHCPTPDMTHPKVYLPIEQNGKARCPYCSTVYTLKGFDPNHSGHE